VTAGSRWWSGNDVAVLTDGPVTPMGASPADRGQASRSIISCAASEGFIATEIP
jgi:hypothetical protein